MTGHSTYFEVISGRRTGMAALIARGLLRPPEVIYKALIRTRNALYDFAGSPAWLDVPVISVGNITVGGTGKTPMTLWICRKLLDRGIRPAVLSRGYKAAAGKAPDELMIVTRRCPAAVAVAHRDRVAAGRLAVREYRVGAAVLDDGFQHRRLGRDLDLVLIDATRPFGYGHLLPRGLLREPVEELARADVLAITRCDQVSPRDRAALAGQLRRLAPQAPIVACRHRPEGFCALDGAAHPGPEGRVGCFAGIARPEAFERTLADLGIAPIAGRWWPDHHDYVAGDLALLDDWTIDERLDMLVTTEKDLVKLTGAGWQPRVPVVCLRVGIEMLDDGEAVLTGLIDEMLGNFNARPACEEPDETQERT